MFHAFFVVSVVFLFLFLFSFNALLGENCPQLFWRSDMQGYLKTNDFRRGFWVSGLIFLSWKHQRNRQLYSSLLCMEETFGLFFSLRNKGKKINRKPHISSCLTSSEVVMNYVWYQATLFKTCRSNCPIVQVIWALTRSIGNIDF